MADDLRQIVSIGPPKEAALYFERVFPFDMAEPFLCTAGVRKEWDSNSIPIRDGIIDNDVVRSVLGSDKAIKNYHQHLGLMLMYMAVNIEGFRKDRSLFLNNGMFMGIVKMLDKELGSDFEKRLNGKDLPELSKFISDTSPAMSRLIVEAGFKSADGWIARNDLSPNEAQSARLSVNDRYMISMTGLDIIEPSSVSWDAVLELRKDTAAMADLRDFRVFFRENFSEQDPNAISDKILSLHDKHKRTARRWGFNLIDKTISAVMTQETLIPTSLAATSLALIGGPAAAIGGALVPIGRAALEIARVVNDPEFTEVDRPFQYLSRLEKLPAGS